MRAGETHEYRIPAQAGDYARVTVDQTGIDVAVRLVGPSGEEVAAADGVGGRKEPELLSWLAREGGDFRLAVTPHEPLGAGSYKIILEDLRPGVPTDPERVAAERVTCEAKHWLAREDEESKRKALDSLEDALTRWQAVGDRSQEVTALSLIAMIHRVLGDTAKALILGERALALALEIGDRNGEAETRNELGVIYAGLGQTDKALELSQSALQIWEELKDLQQVGTALYNLAILQLQRGESESSFQYLNRALEARRAAGSLDRSLILNGIARVHLDKGDLDTALLLLAEALDLSRKRSDRHDEANTLQVTASVNLRRGELQKAFELYMEAYDLYRLLGERAHEGQVLSNLGATSLYLGNPDQALDYYTRALAIHQAIKNVAWEAYALRDIGWIYDLRGAPEISLDYYTRSFKISQTVNHRPTQAMALQGMGRARIALGQSLEAVRLLEDALEIFRSTGNALAEIHTLLELGRAWQAASDPARAAKLFDQALALGRQRHTLFAEAVAQSDVARLERERGNLPAAAAAIQEALRIIESVRSKVAGQRLRSSFFASRRDYYDFYVDLLMRMHRQDAGAGYLAAALSASEMARARVLLDLLAEGRIDVRQGITQELKQRETEIAQRISWLQTQLLDDLSGRGKGGITAPEIEAGLAHAEEERERLDWQIRREHPRYAAVRYPSPLPLEEIQGLLDDRTALLEYAVGKESSYLFVVTRDTLAGYPLPPSGELGEMVEAVHAALKEPRRRLFGQYVETARRLYEILISPAEPLLRDKPRLIISPDGPLLLLSFEALLTAPAPAGERSYGGLPYLILERSVTYVPSASVLAELKMPEAAARNAGGAAGAKLFLGFGAPDYGSSEQLSAPAATLPQEGPLSRAFRAAGLPHLQPLPQSRHEVQKIAGLFPQDQVALYLNGQASEENVKANPFLKTARWIHFAVHGLLNEPQPELSGLVLTLDQDSREDGLLQVYEIFNLELSADLVVLSACDTGLGKNVTGEGLLGVTRSFLYAGAASVVVSLWEVADTSTADFMVRFYRDLNRSDKAEALRLSKLEMIREGSFSHPYYWAPFVLVGQPGQRTAVTTPSLARQ